MKKTLILFHFLFFLVKIVAQTYHTCEIYQFEGRDSTKKKLVHTTKFDDAHKVIYEKINGKKNEIGVKSIKSESIYEYKDTFLVKKMVISHDVKLKRNDTIQHVYAYHPETKSVMTEFFEKDKKINNWVKIGEKVKKYDTQKQVIAITENSKDFTYRHQYEYIYNPNNQLAERNIYNPDTLLEKEIYIYQENQFIKKRTVFKTNSSWITEYNYHPTHHLLTKEIGQYETASKDIITDYIIQYQYDTYQRISTKQYFDEQNKLLFTQKYKYF
jgi:hypothetical protein